MREEFHTQIEDRRRVLDTELTVIEALVRMGGLDAAAHALEDQRLALRALGLDLKVAVADALAERSAEQALDAWRGLPVPAGASVAARDPRVRPRLALALVAVVLGLVLVPGVREQSLPVLSASQAREAGVDRAAWSEIHAARERLARFEPTQADAERVAAEARAVHDQILALPDRALASTALQAEIRGLLAQQSGALRVFHSDPDAKSLLAEVHALSTSLGLELPEPQIQPPPAPVTKVSPAPVLEQVPPQQPASQQPAPEQLAPQTPDKPVADLPLPEQPAAERPGTPDAGRLDVRPADQAPRPGTSAPKPDLQR